MADNNGSALKTVLAWALVVVLAIAALKLAFWVLGVVVGIGTFLLFTIVPLVVAGWIVLWVIRQFRKRDDYDHL